MPGRVLGDVAENTHTQVRKMDPYPTVVKYLRIAKAIFITQFLKVTGGSYDHDDSTEYLTQFENIKELEKEKEQEAADDFQYFINVEFEPGNVAENSALSYIFGYILHKVIDSPTKRGNYKKCRKCITVWTQKTGEPQEENSLIISKDFTEGALMKPSILGNQVVRSIEALFIANRDELMEKSELLSYFNTKVLELKKELEFREEKYKDFEVLQKIAEDEVLIIFNN